MSVKKKIKERKIMVKILKNKKGLTLIELIAVIVILGVIAAIAIPLIGNTLDNQREEAAVLSYQNIETAALLYAANGENEGAAFSVQDMIDGDYLDFTGTFTDGTDDILATDIFDVDGELDLPVEITTIEINGYQVYPAA
jgi:prepilin-type N-terminal cleavage/methylation domain-containing protein